MIEIRPAVYDEIFAIEACLLQAREEIDFAIPEHDEPFVFHNFMHQIEARLLAVAAHDGEVVGAIALAIHHWPWAPKTKFVTNEHFYVVPAHRKGGTAEKLLDFAKERAAQLGMALRIDLIGAGNRAMKDRFMQMNGFRYLGGQFIFEG